MSRIFLDSGDPQETQEIIQLLSAAQPPRQLDGQTTNPTLVSKNPYAKGRADNGDKFTEHELLAFYKQVIQDISKLIPHGSVSIEVYADDNTSAQEMIEQAEDMWTWIPNAHIKLPTTAEGLKAARALIDKKMRVNMTLVFSQQQAAAVHAATTGAQKGDVFLSPFIGRLDDIGQNGMDLIANCLKMYRAADSHVEVLTASVRSVEHLQAALQLNSDIITAPHKILKPWAEAGAGIEENFTYQSMSANNTPLAPIAYEELDLSQNWSAFNIGHELTTKGISSFTEDWNKLIAR
ncbi:transaldolase [Candidatus Peregrinibacteria bacterium CG11_big_fil_rev_8_21_14_0_20_46_8]|nr:MAG: transaldolase [Candidatus Peregrinibacteria bacterium CG11_big_fil_rev_8_21_14_0_20_46_8]